MSNDTLWRRVDPFAVLAVLIPLFVHLLTLAPTVTFFDSGEFLTAVSSLGTAHSPGYPLFINYAKPFTFLPFGSIAFRVNIATAVSAALACFGVYLLVSHLLAAEESDEEQGMLPFVRKGVALVAALTFAFTPRLWLQSNHDKPYPLVSFLAALVFYLVLLWREKYRKGEERPAYIYLGAFLCGLGLGAHQTIVLMLPSYAFLIITMNWRLIGRVKEIIIATAFGLLGFSVHLHMIVRATRSPLLNWGDSKTLTQFLWNMLRKGYPVDKPVRDWRLLWEQINAFNVPHEFTWVGMALLLIGALACIRKKPAEVVSYFVGVLFFLLVIAGYFNTPRDLIFLTEEFFTPLYLLSAVFIGLGVFHLLNLLMGLLPKAKRSATPVQLAAVMLALIMPATVCALHYVENDQHDNYVAFDYASNTLRSLPPDAVLFTWGDSGAFPLWYLQGVEKMREDLDLLHTPHLVFPWYLDSFPRLFHNSMLRQIPDEALSSDSVLLLAVAEQIERRPVFVDFSTRYSVAFPQYRLQQKGICYQLEKVNESILRPPDLAIWDLYNTRGLTSTMFFRDLDTSKAILIYASSYLESGETLLRVGKVAEGIMALRFAARISPELRDQVEQVVKGYVTR